MVENFETERQGFVEAYKAEQRRLLAQFIERHKPEDLPALDFTEEEAKIFVPEKLLLLPEIDPEKIKVEIPRQEFVGKNFVSVFIRDERDGECLLDFSFEKRVRVFRKEKLPALFIHNYSDSRIIRGKLITEDFFKKITVIAREIAFKIIVGENSYRNIGYFVEKLGRFPEFTLLDKEDLDKEDGLGRENYCITYSFLDPKDAEKNVKPEYLSNQAWRKGIETKIWPPFNLETGRGVIRDNDY